MRNTPGAVGYGEVIVELQTVIFLGLGGTLIPQAQVQPLLTYVFDVRSFGIGSMPNRKAQCGRNPETTSSGPLCSVPYRTPFLLPKPG